MLPGTLARLSITVTWISSNAQFGQESLVFVYYGSIVNNRPKMLPLGTYHKGSCRGEVADVERRPFVDVLLYTQIKS